MLVVVVSAGGGVTSARKVCRMPGYYCQLRGTHLSSRALPGGRPVVGQDDGELVPSAELLTLATELGGVSGDSAETKQHKKRDLRRWDAANIKLPREFSLLPLPSCKRRIVQHEGTALRGCNL
eukprot:scaffold220366_cov35-Tisochrysis_lutea.AAC.1